MKNIPERSIAVQISNLTALSDVSKAMGRQIGRWTDPRRVRLEGGQEPDMVNIHVKIDELISGPSIIGP